MHGFFKASCLAALFFVGIFIAPTSLAQSFLTNGLVAYYPFNGNADDASGNGFNAATISGAILCSDRFGNKKAAYEFDGATGFISISDRSGALNFDARNDNYSVSLWVKLNTIKVGDQKFIADRFNNSPCSYDIYYRGSLNAFKLDIWDGGYGGFSLTSQTGTSPNTWHQVAIVVSNRLCQLYLDGIEDTGGGSYLSANTGTTKNSDGICLIGSDLNNCTTRLHGIESDIRIYNRALSKNEVAQLYNAELHSKNPKQTQGDTTQPASSQSDAPTPTSPQIAAAQAKQEALIESFCPRGQNLKSFKAGFISGQKAGVAAAMRHEKITVGDLNRMEKKLPNISDRSYLAGFSKGFNYSYWDTRHGNNHPDVSLQRTWTPQQGYALTPPPTLMPPQSDTSAPIPTPTLMPSQSDAPTPTTPQINVVEVSTVDYSNQLIGVADLSSAKQELDAINAELDKASQDQMDLELKNSSDKRKIASLQSQQEELKTRSVELDNRILELQNQEAYVFQSAGALLDAKNFQSALQAYKDFIAKFPNSVRIASANDIIASLQAKLGTSNH